MKPFGVASIRMESLMDWGFLNRDQVRERQRDAELLNTTGVAYHEPPPVGQRWEGSHYDEDVFVYWTDNLSDAIALANELSKKFSGRTFVAFESKTSFMSTPGTPRRSLFTTKGVVPA